LLEVNSATGVATTGVAEAAAAVGVHLATWCTMDSCVAVPDVRRPLITSHGNLSVHDRQSLLMALTCSTSRPTGNGTDRQYSKSILSVIIPVCCTVSLLR
jgi:hypothetical protein